MGPQDLLDALDEIVYVSDPNTYELLYANRRCRSLLPTRDYKGKPCYALLQGQPAPCPYCTNARLTPDKFYVWEFNNPSMGRHFLLKDKLIDWDGRPARLEIAVDITEQELLSRDTARKLETERTLVECIRRLGGSAEQAVYIGDSAYDMQCAAAAGVKSGLALWGSETPDALQADMRLTHPSELLLL